MDFIDSLVLDDVNTKPSKKSHRVRSWLLCEHYYKYLEKSQVDDALKQRKFYQDTILEHELCERRARRRVREAGMCAGDTALHGADSRHCTATGLSSDLECLQDDDSEVEFFHESQEKTDLDSITENGNGPCSLDETNEYEDVKESMSCTSRPSHSEVNEEDTETVDSVLNSTRDRDTELKGKLEHITNKIMDDIKLQMKDVEDNLQSLERYTELEGQGCDEESLASVEHSRLKKRCKDEDILYDTSMQTMWARVVSFAYQLIQLNHGNCYYDYSAQFLTAVLAFDVLRRGFNKMCDILQPYVSPIKFACDQSSWSENTECFVKRKKVYVPKCCRKSTQFKRLLPHSLRKKNDIKCYRTRCTDAPSQPCCFGDGLWESRGWEVDPLASRIRQQMCLQSSEPLRNTVYSSTKHRTDKPYVQSQRNIEHHICSCDQMWPKQRHDQKSVSCSCQSCRTVVANPMLRIASHFDSLLKQIDEPGV